MSIGQMYFFCRPEYELQTDGCESVKRADKQPSQCNLQISQHKSHLTVKAQEK